MLKPIHIPMVLLLQTNLFHYLTNFVFNGAIFWMVQWPQVNGKIARTDTAHHRVVNICTEMHSKVVPNQYSVKVRACDIVCLNIVANVVAKITESIGGCANGAQTSDPTLRVLNTSTNIWRKSWVPWHDCKDDSDLRAVVVVSILSDKMYLYSPPPRAIAFFMSHTKLVNVNEFPSGHLKHAKRKRAVPKAPDVELHVRLLSLVGFSGCLLLCDFKLLQLLRDGLTGEEFPPSLKMNAAISSSVASSQVVM
jgi:hypothetical protein